MTDQKEWYLPDNRGREPQGPFSFEEIKRKFDQGDLRLDDYLWCSDMKQSQWFRLFEFQEAQKLMVPYPICPPPKQLSRGIHQETFQEAFEEGEVRSDTSAHVDAKILIHNQKDYLKALCERIYSRGAELVAGAEFCFQKGEEIQFNLYDHSKLGAFSVPSVVREIKPQSDGIWAEVYFLRVNPDIRQRLGQYLKETTA